MSLSSLKILVCIKEVPAGDMRIRIDDTGRWIETGDHDNYVMNRFDEYALEEAVRIKEHFAGTAVEVLSVGPESCRAVIRRALAKGADTGLHLHDSSPGCPTAENVAAAIAGVCKTRGYDLILTGVISEDLMQGVTGPLVAARLDIPCATAVVHQRIAPDKGTVQAACELEGGWTADVRLALPALLTIQTGINRPRYPSLSNMMRSRRQALTTLPVETPPRADNTPCITALDELLATGGATFLEGTPAKQAANLLDLLMERGLLIT